MEERIIGIADLVQDDKNFNKGTERGMQLMESSLSKLGAGRSVLIDKNNRLIAGNKTAVTAEKVGITDVVVVETEGDEIIAVKRIDLDLDSTKGREMALADNITAKKNVKLDYNTIKECVDEVQMDTEAWGIKDLDKLIAQSQQLMEREEKKKLDVARAVRRSGAATPVRFGGYTITPTQEEYDRFNEIIDEYFEENGVLIGFIAELLGI